MGSLAILMLLHLAMRRGGCSPGWTTIINPGSATAQPVARIAREVDRCGRAVRGAGRRGRLSCRDHDGRLPAGDDPRARQRHFDPPRRLSWTVTFMIGLFLAGSDHRHIRGDQQDRRDADLVPLVCSAGLRAWIVLYLLMDVAGFREPGRSSSVPPAPTHWSPTSCTRS